MAYEFTAEDYHKFSEDLLNAEGDQATVTSILAEMQSTVMEAIGRDVAAQEQVTKVTEENERLRASNRDLFFRLGSKPEESQIAAKPQPEIKDTKSYMEEYFQKLENGRK